MTARQPARSAVRRRRAVLGAVLVLLLAASTFAPSRHALKRKPHPLIGTDRTHLPAVRWPQQGQAAFVLGNGRPASSPHEHPVPIASLAKVMTAYLTLEHYPLGGTQDGFTITVTSVQAQDEAEEAAQNQSGVAVVAGEQLTE